MNYERGFKRIYVVVAVCWVALCALGALALSRDPGSIYCGDEFYGDRLIGPTRLSLFDSERGQLLNTLKIVGPVRYPKEENNVGNLRTFPVPHVRVGAAEDSFALPFLVTSSYYHVPVLNSKEEGTPVILTLRDLTGQGVAAEFVLFAYQACGIASTSVLGYSQQSDIVMQYPVEVVQSGQEPQTGVWVEQIFRREPMRPSYWNFTWDPGHGAEEMFHEEVSFDRRRQLFVDRHESVPRSIN